MQLVTTLALLTTLALSAAEFSSLSSSRYTFIQNKIRSAVRGTTIPTMVRLAFHDCVGGRPSLTLAPCCPGGCDGCLNVNNEDNAGLADLVAALDTIYLDNGYDTVLSR